MQAVQKTGDSPGAVLGSVGTRPSLCNDRPGWSRQFSLEVPQVQFLRFWARLVAVKGFWAHFAPLFALLQVVPELSARCSWGALNDFLVLRHRGLGGGADAGSFSQVSGHQSCACQLIFQPDRAGVDRHMR